MSSFGKKLRECREAKNLSQKDLANLLNTSYSVVGKYERDEMQPSIKVAQTLANLLNTTVGYLLGESEDAELLKDPAMLKRLQDILNLPKKEKESLLLNIDHFIKAAKINLI